MPYIPARATALLPRSAPTLRPQLAGLTLAFLASILGLSSPAHAQQGGFFQPEILVQPVSHDYGNVTLGSSVSRSFLVQNRGRSELLVTASLAGHGADSEFTIDGGETTFEVPPRTSESVSVTFHPTGLGDMRASLRITSNDPDESRIDVPLWGSGVVPDIAVDAAAHDYGGVRGGDSVSWTFQLRNDGTGNLHVTSLTMAPDADEFQLVRNPGSFVLKPSQSTPVEVAFSPRAEGERGATLLIESDDPDENPLEVTLSGAGLYPHLAVEPAAHDYGPVSPGESTSQVFEITNSGTADLQVSAITLAGVDAGEFRLASPAIDLTLLPSESTSIEVNFEPTGEGTRSAALRIESDAAEGSLLEVPLSGAGVLPDIACTPASHDYGPVPIGSIGIQAFEIRNEGTAELRVASLTISGSDATEFRFGAPPAELTLPPAGSISIHVIFEPTRDGAKSAKLRIRSNDPDEDPLEMPLSGTALLPYLEVDPKSHDFGPVAPGESVSQTFEITNSGTADLQVTSVAIAGDGEFRLVENPGIVTLPPATSIPVEVTFEPSGAGPRGAVLRIESDVAGSSVLEVPLVGTGVLPDIGCSPTSHDYGPVPGGSSTTQAFEIRNDGTADLHLTSLRISGSGASNFRIASHPADVTLPPARSISIDVIFEPLEEGARSATLRIVSNDPDESPFEVALSGAGSFPHIEVDPVLHDFGTVVPGEGVAQVFEITNSGSADLQVSSVTIAGADPGEFRIGSLPPDLTLLPSASMSIDVAFEPTGDGPKSAVLRIESNAAEGTLREVPLSGTGVLPDITFTPASHDYGQVPVGGSGARVFELRNDGTADLRVTSLTISGSDAIEFRFGTPPAELTLPPAQGMSFHVFFEPSGDGPKSAMLRIVSNDPDESPLDVPLSGAGISPDIAIDAASHDYGGIQYGESATHIFELRNEGAGDLHLGSVILQGGNAGDFRLVGAPEGLVLPPTQTANLEVVFAPSGAGPRSTTLRIESDDPDENPLDVLLSGSGTVPDIAVDDASHDYGMIPVGEGATSVFDVRNEGTADLHVTAVTIVGESASDFRIATSAGGFTVSPAFSVPIGVIFEPAGEGPASATLRIESDDPDESPVTVALFGSAIAPIAAPVTFAASGDYPDGSGELPDLEEHVQLWNLYSGAEFFCHLGDIVGPTDCDVALYRAAADILKTSEIPVFVTPGDHEWTNCGDADQGRAWWEEVFGRFEENFCSPFHVERQFTRSENFAFVRKGVLFVGVNVPGDIDGDARLQDAAQWVVTQLDRKRPHVRAAVVLGHAGPGSSRTAFFDPFRAGASVFGKPILYLHGNDRDWQLDQPFPELNMWRLSVEEGSREQPVEITVGMDPVNPFEFLRTPWEDDPAPANRPPCGAGEIYVSDVTVLEGRSGTGPARFTFSLVGGDGRQVSVDWATAEGTASPGEDYVTKSGTIVLSGSTRSREILVSVRGDQVPEPTEEFTLELGNATNGAALAKDRAIVTILDDDAELLRELTVTVEGSGLVTLDPPGGSYLLGTLVELTAVPDSGWSFDRWSGSLAGGANPNFLIIAEDASITASFLPNHPPLAIPDLYAVDEDFPLVVGEPGVLLNDTDPDLDSLSVIPHTTPQHGSLSLGEDGSFTYVPSPDYFGPDLFTYRVSDGRGAVDAADVTIDVRPVNDPPLGVADFYVTEGALLVVGAPGVLGNDTDVEGDVLFTELDEPPAHGELLLNPDGSFTYDPAPGFQGTDAFVYQADDGGALSELVVVTILVGQLQVVTLLPTDDAHVYSGVPSRNYGDDPGLRTRHGPPSYHPYLKFSLEDMNLVLSAKLRLYVTDPTTDGGTVYLTSNEYAGGTAPWDETELTFANAPPLEGLGLGSLGAVAVDEWVEIDVSSAIDRNGTFSFGLSSGSSNSGWYSSKEGDFPPQLVVEGYSITPDIAVSPGAHEYGPVPLAINSSQTFEVQNNGADPLMVDGASVVGIDASDFSVLSGGGPLTLVPAQTAIIEVSFHPATVGPKIAVLRIASNDPDASTFDVALTGTGAAPDIAITPQSHDYGNLRLAATATRLFVVRNEGDHTLTVTSTTLTGLDSTDFHFSVGSGGFTLAPADSATVGVSFQPSSVGPKAAALRLVSNDPDESPTEISLAGGGVEPDIAVHPDSLDFGGVLLADPPSVHTLGILNAGAAELLVSALTLVGAEDFDLVVDPVPFTLAPGDTLTVEVSFSPAGEGSRTATLSITSDDPDESLLEVPLTGAGVRFDLALDSTALDFEDVLLGETAARSVVARNEGSTVLSVAASIEGLDADQFDLDAEAFTIAPAESASIEVVFRPTSAGAKAATLRLANEDPAGGALDVTLAGVGIAPPTAEIVLEETSTGGSSSETVTTAPLDGGDGPDLYLAAVAAKSRTDVTAVTGLGLTWVRVRAQCSGRDQTGVEIWRAVGPSAGGAVTATLGEEPRSAVIAVARYSGADPDHPVGAVVAGNTNGADGACTGGDDDDAYSFDLDPTVDGAVVFAAAAMRNRFHTPGAGFVERAAVDQGSGGSAASLAIVDGALDTISPVNVSGSFSDDVDWAVLAVEIRPGTAFARGGTLPAAAGRGERDRFPASPDAYLLDGYPNPFRTEATIEYALPRPVPVSIVIYNIQGREVRRLVDRVEPPGERRVRWNARNNAGSAVGPGIYFLQMRTPDRTLTKKLVLDR